MKVGSISRRAFVSLGTAALVVDSRSAGAQTASPAPFSGWHRGEFQVHFIYTGVAESLFVICPDSTSILIDCGDIPAIMRRPYDVPVPRPREMAGETVANYVLKVNLRGRDVDYLVVSHWHSDHTGTPNWQSCGTMVDRSGGRYWRSGFGIAAEKLRFAKAIDRGVDEPIAFVDGAGRSAEHMRRLYSFLAERDGLVREKVRLGATDQFCLRHGGSDGFFVRTVAANGKVAASDGTVRDLYAKFLSDHPGTTLLNENGLSVGLLFGYGPFRFFTAGDFCDRLDGIPTEDGLAEVCEPVDVAKINHHGHHSMSEKLVAALKARCYAACVWDQLHITDDTMTRLSDQRLYPGPRTFYPGVFTAERQREDADRAWTRNVAPALRSVGGHVVLTVEPGGRAYTMTCLDASAESMAVKSVDRYRARNAG